MNQDIKAVLLIAKKVIKLDRNLKKELTIRFGQPTVDAIRNSDFSNLGFGKIEGEERIEKAAAILNSQ